ncbi:MAG: SMC family ATPase [Candidatus Aenigmatarchaeota archaeon]
MITKVKLKNWRSHLDSEFNFSDGTNCFVGSMGSGKTSVMDAICFGLFGTFLQLQQRKLKLEDIVMKKPVKKDKAEVSVYFDINGTEFNVKRIIENGRSSAELRKNGELIEGPHATKVTKEVERILKMDYDLFTRAVYSEQNQLDMFLTIPKGERMKKIDQLLAIDKFEKARANTRSLVSRCLDLLREKERIVKNLEADESLKKIELLRRQFMEYKEKEVKFKKQLEDIVKKKSRTEKDIIVLKTQQKRMQEIEEEKKKFTALLEVTEKDIEKLKDELVEFAEMTKDQMEKEAEIISGDIQELNLQIESERQSMDKLRGEYAEDNAAINLIESERLPKVMENVEELRSIEKRLKKSPLRKLESELSKSRSSLENGQIKLQKSIVKLSEIEDSINELNLAGSACPVCDGKLPPAKKTKLLTTKKKKIDELKKEIKKLQPDVIKIKRSINKLEEEINETKLLKQKFEELKDSEKEMRSLNDLLNKSKSKTKVFDTQKRMFEKNIQMLEDSLSKFREKQEKIKKFLSKEEEVTEKLNRSKKYRQDLVMLDKEKEQYLSFSPAILDKYESDYRSIIILEREIETNLKNLSTILDEKKNLLDEIKSKKEMLENFMLEIRKTHAITDQLKLLANALVITQEQLRKEFVSAVNEAMQTIWNELYPYKDIYNIRLGIEGGDYVLQLQDSTGWIPADGIASGGERSMAALTLRIAFSLVLAPQLKWLVLDEPTHNLDSRAVDELANVLRERINSFVDQVFLITHDPSLENAVSGYLYRLDREKEKDGFTKVSLVSGPDVL